MPRWASRVLLVCAATWGCAPTSRSQPLEAPERRPVPPPIAAPAVTGAPEAAPAPRAQIDPDGNDDPEEPGEGTIPAPGHFERVGRPPLALQRICDLTPFQGALYAAHANQPLGTDGATITRYVPRPRDGTGADAGTRLRSPFSVAFDWNRPGEPTEGGGAGQGFLRVHAIGGRLFVPDADPPYNGFGISEGGTEGFVFVSDDHGRFAGTVGEHLRPPSPPTVDGGAGAAMLPRAYHVLDVIRFRGRLFASTGSVPPKERAWRGPSPGALHIAVNGKDGSPSLSRWLFQVGYPYPWQDGVWRLGYLVRFQDRLFAGIQDYDGREPNDFVVVSPEADRAEAGALAAAAGDAGEPPFLTQEDIRPSRVTERGGALTLRWYADRGALYWIALERTGKGSLWVTRDGASFREIDLPEEMGRPTDIVRFRDGLVVLGERGLSRLAPGEGGGDSELHAELLGRVSDKKSPFELTDSFCAAPLAVFDGELYAGGQRDGSLYRWAPGEG